MSLHTVMHAFQIGTWHAIKAGAAALLAFFENLAEVLGNFLSVSNKKELFICLTIILVFCLVIFTLQWISR